KSPGVEYPEIPTIIHGLGEIKTAEGRYAEAESLELRAVEMLRKSRGSKDLETGWALWTLGKAFQAENKLTEAEQPLREALGIFRRQYSVGHKSVDNAMSVLQDLLRAKGDSAGLEALANEQMAEWNSRIERNSGDAQAWSQRALIRAGLKLWKGAIEDYEQV